MAFEISTHLRTGCNVRHAWSSAGRGCASGSASGRDTALAEEAVLLAEPARHVGSRGSRSSRASAPVGIVRDAPTSTHVDVVMASLGEPLGKRRPLAQRRALPVDDVDGNDEHEGNTEEDGARILEILAARFTNVLEERQRGDSEDTGEEVSGPAVAAGCRGRVWTVGTNHVVNGSHIDCIVCDSDNGDKDHGAYPVNGRTLNCPSKSDETNGQARRSVQQEPQTRLILRSLIIGLLVPLLDVPSDGRDKEDPGNHISDTDGDETQADLDGRKAPLLIHKGEGLDEHEDEGVGETREQGEDEDNGLGEEHAERADPGGDDLLGRESLAEGDKLVGTPDIGSRIRLTTTLGDTVHHDGAARLRHGEEMYDLDEATKDKLDPDGPPERRRLETQKDGKKY
jgi:hypothetical protein